jgi:hypothetical protein
MLLWDAVFALSGIGMLFVSDSVSSHEARLASTVMAAVLIIGGVAAATFVATRANVQRVRRELIFILTDDGIVSKTVGWPDVRINFSEMTSLWQKSDCLVLEDTSSQRKITIPREVANYDLLVSELTKYGQLKTEAQPQSKTGFVPTILFYVALGVFLWTKQNSVVVASASIASLFLGWTTFRSLTKIPQIPKRALWLSLIVLGWVMWLVLVYFRLSRDLMLR